METKKITHNGYDEEYNLNNITPVELDKLLGTSLIDQMAAALEVELSALVYSGKHSDQQRIDNITELLGKYKRSKPGHYEP